MTDALPGTSAGSETECDYCGSECVCVACDASEFEQDEEEGSEVPDVEEWELEMEEAYRRLAEAEIEE